MAASTSGYPQGPGLLCLMPSHESSYGLMWRMNLRNAVGTESCLLSSRTNFYSCLIGTIRRFSSQPLALAKLT
ncbi:mCG63074, isoform CRA_a [Mus musculus]|nr:mCG63074, isoform CRA_a [Mus musculus]EDL04437.1 mCG63074, isoform CRA_a [Mus musculus]